MASVANLAALVADLERHLGDPSDDSAPVNYTDLLALDEREEYPAKQLEHLQDWSLQDYQVPAASGGRAIDFQDSFMLMRLVARRDATLATALSYTSLAYLPVWVAGTDEQRRVYGDMVRNRVPMAMALSERDHGSDLLANRVEARPVDGGYLLSGEKWPVGNITAADVVMMFVRTHPGGAAGGFSLLMVDKRTLPADRVEARPKEPVLGVRGIDLSGLQLTDCFIPASARIGPEGRGLELALKSAFPARIMVNALALGCADTALRTVLDFAVRRNIFGQYLADIPVTRKQLAECFADLLVADVVATGAARSLQTAPRQASVWSAIAKYLVPTLLEGTVSQCGVIMGARHYMRGQGSYGMVQKTLRDLRFTNFVDGNTIVNLKNVAVQLDGLLAGALSAPDTLRAEAAERMRVLADWDAPLPHYEPWAVEMASRGSDDALLALPATLRALRALAADAGDPAADRIRAAVGVGERLPAEIQRLTARAAELRTVLGRGYGLSGEVLDLAREYSVVHAIATYLHHWAYSRHWARDPFPDAALLLLGVERLWRWFHPTERLAGPDVTEAAARALVGLHASGRLFSHHQFPLGGEAS